MKVDKRKKLKVAVANVVPVVKTGRRKRAVVTARLYAGGDGMFVVNGVDIKEYFYYDVHLDKVLRPFIISGASQDAYSLFLRVNGGGLSAQSDAASLAIARALACEEEDRVGELKANKLLTSDGRRKERKKFGRLKARKVRQFSKR